MFRKILIVDDELMVAGFMHDVLRSLGHQAREVYSGKEALDVLLEDDSFGLVITDLSMPKMNGFELADCIKETKPDLQIALVTANVCAESGNALRVLPKPYSRAELRSLLSELDNDHLHRAH